MKRNQLWASLATVVTLANIALPSYTVAAQGLSGNSSGEIPFSITIDEEPTVDPEVPTDPTDPTEPTDPEVPGDGETPTDPEVPGDGDGETPTDPEVPGDGDGDGETPTDPTEPTDPEIPGDGGTGETPTDPEVPTDPEIPAEPETPTESDYVITIPSGLDAKPKLDVGLEKVKLVDFEVTAQNVNLPDEQAVQVDVTAKDEYQIDGKNVLKGQGNESIAYDFERDESLEYGFVDGFDDGDESSDWTIAQFRDADHEKFTDVAPVSITTTDLLILPGSYNSMLQFNVGVVDTAVDVGGGDGGTVTPEVPAEPEVPVDSNPYLQGEPTDAKYFSTWSNGDGTADIIDYDLENGPKEVVIPSEINGEKIVNINTMKFNYSNITSIEIPGTVKTIKKEQFMSPQRLTKIVLNEGLETIENRAFYWNAAEEIIIPDSVKTVGPQAFYQSTIVPLKKVVIGANATFLEPSGKATGLYFGETSTGSNGSKIPVKLDELHLRGMTDRVSVMTQMESNLQSSYTLYVQAGSDIEEYARVKTLKFEYIGEAPDRTKEDADFAAMIPNSRNFAKDGVVQIGEDLLNENPIDYMTSYNVVTKGVLIVTPVSSSKTAATTTSKSAASTKYFPVVPGETYRFDFGGRTPYKFDIIGTNKVVATDTTHYALTTMYSVKGLSGNYNLYKIPAGTNYIALNITDTLASTYGTEAFNAYRMIRIK